MYDKPLIGLNVDVRGDRPAGSAYCVTFLPRWLECLTRAGGIPVLVPPLADETDINQVLDRLDGLVLVGQRDVPASCAGRSRGHEDDLPELLLMRLIAQRRMPFLGIGLGLQLLNLCRGGTLARLEAEVPRRTFHLHPHNPQHLLWTTPGSLMGRLYGNGTTLVNSLHELAIDRVARGFVATARCTVGVIEALESQTDDWFALGVQFHPEPDACQDTDLRLFEAFVDEVLAQGSAAPARAVPYYV